LHIIIFSRACRDWKNECPSGVALGQWACTEVAVARGTEEFHFFVYFAPFLPFVTFFFKIFLLKKIGAMIGKNEIIKRGGRAGLEARWSSSRPIAICTEFAVGCTSGQTSRGRVGGRAGLRRCASPWVNLFISLSLSFSLIFLWLCHSSLSPHVSHLYSTHQDPARPHLLRKFQPCYFFLKKWKIVPKRCKIDEKIKVFHSLIPRNLFAQATSTSVQVEMAVGREDGHWREGQGSGCSFLAKKLFNLSAKLR